MQTDPKRGETTRPRKREQIMTTDKQRGTPMMLLAIRDILLGAAVLTAITLFVIPMQVDEPRRPFTPAQLELIAEKERARPLNVAMAAGEPNAGLVVGGATQSTGLAPVNSSVSTALTGVYSYKGGNVSDPVSLFFGGVGSSWDVVWDLTHEPYSPGFPQPAWDPKGNGVWMEGHTKDGKIQCNPQQLMIDGVWADNNTELVTAEAYQYESWNRFSLGPLHCALKVKVWPPLEKDASRMHVRLWNGGSDPVHGSWSVATPHWDSPAHASYYAELVESTVVRSFLDTNGQPLWFVGAIWTFNFVDNTSGTAVINTAAGSATLCLDTGYEGEPVPPCDGTAHYIQLLA
jgi:hypothetical protein